MQKRVTRGSSGPQKRQVRMYRRLLESEGIPASEARSRADAKRAHVGRAGASRGGRIVSKEAETAELAQRPKRRVGIKVEDGVVKLPRRITTKIAEAAMSGHSLRKRSTKSRK